MILLHIPAEHADAVREAMPSFWWGVKVIEGYYEASEHGARTVYLRPAYLQAMLDPCQHLNARMICGVPGDGDDWMCDDCGADDGNDDGVRRPLVELVTDCLWRDHWIITPQFGGGARRNDVHTDIRCPVSGCLDATVTLGVVTADPNSLPIYTEDDALILHPAHPCIIIKYDGGAVVWSGDGDITPITLHGPSDATHAIRLESVICTHPEDYSDTRIAP